MWSLFLISGILWDNNDVSRNMIETIKKCNLLFVEELKIFQNFMKDNNIIFQWRVVEMTFNNDKYYELIKILLKKNGNVWIFESSWTPCFIDPWTDIVSYVYREREDIEAEIIHIPWGSALTAAISLSWFKIEKFLFDGFFSEQSFILTSKSNHVNIFFISHEDFFSVWEILSNHRQYLNNKIFLWINMSKRGVFKSNSYIRWHVNEVLEELDELYLECKKQNHIPDVVLVYDKS